MPEDHAVAEAEQDLTYNDRLSAAYRAAGYSDADLDMPPAERARLRAASGVGGGMALSAIESAGFAIAVGVPQIGGSYHYGGVLGADLDVETGAKAAELAALSAVNELRGTLGDLSRVERLVFMQVFVTSAPGFVRQPQVANGASRAMHAIFGEQGKHVRAALGVVGMAGGQSIEVIALFKLAD